MSERQDFRPPVIQNPVRLRYSLASDIMEEAGEALLTLHETNYVDWEVLKKLRFDLTAAQSRIRRIVLDYIPEKDRPLVKDLATLWQNEMKEEAISNPAVPSSRWIRENKRGFMNARNYLEVKFNALERLMQSVHELMEVKNWYEPKRDDFVIKVPHEEMSLIEKTANEEREKVVADARASAEAKV